MTFQVLALPAGSYQHLFDMDEAQIADIQAERRIVSAKPGFPCRISLEDANEGEEVILVNHTHLPEASPYQSCHAVYVRKGVVQAELAVGEVPAFFRLRDISVRAFNQDHIMVNACVVSKGGDVREVALSFFEDPAVDYIHFHFAGPGCFAAKAERV